MRRLPTAPAASFPLARPGSFCFGRQWCDIDFQQGEEANKEFVACEGLSSLSHGSEMSRGIRGRVEELLKHLEKDFASQLVKTAVRQAEARLSARPSRMCGPRAAACGRLWGASCSAVVSAG